VWDRQVIFFHFIALARYNESVADAIVCRVIVATFHSLLIGLQVLNTQNSALKCLQSLFGYEQFRGDQQAVIERLVQQLCQNGVRAAFVNSSLTAQQNREIEEQAMDGKLDMLYMAPERIVSQSGQQLLSRINIALLDFHQ